MGDIVFIRDPAAREHGETAARVDETCATAVCGRRAARIVAKWAQRFGLTEAEFQLLWRLRSAPPEGFDQSALAGALAFSPAQISASVERLRAQGRICPAKSAADRRRRHWQLSTTGRELLDRMLVAAMLVRRPPGSATTHDHSGGVGREAAA